MHPCIDPFSLTVAFGAIIGGCSGPGKQQAGEGKPRLFSVEIQAFVVGGLTRKKERKHHSTDGSELLNSRTKWLHAPCAHCAWLFRWCTGTINAHYVPPHWITTSAFLFSILCITSPW